jgi:hypothetical protein
VAGRPVFPSLQARRLSSRHRPCRSHGRCRDLSQAPTKIRPSHTLNVRLADETGRQVGDSQWLQSGRGQRNLWTVGSRTGPSSRRASFLVDLATATARPCSRAESGSSRGRHCLLLRCCGCRSVLPRVAVLAFSRGPAKDASLRRAHNEDSFFQRTSRAPGTPPQCARPRNATRGQIRARDAPAAQTRRLSARAGGRGRHSPPERPGPRRPGAPRGTRRHRPRSWCAPR